MLKENHKVAIYLEGHFIEVGGLNDLGSIGPDVGPAHVIDHNQNDIGFLLCVGEGAP